MRDLYASCTTTECTVSVKHHVQPQNVPCLLSNMCGGIPVLPCTGMHSCETYGAQQTMCTVVNG